MIDTHSHINFEEYKKDFDFVLNEIRENDVSKVIIPGVSAETFEEINSYCTKYEMLYGAVGVHPSEVKTYNDNTEKQIIKYLNCPKIVAIGEIGLDYHWETETKEEQKLVLQKQLQLAQEYKVPVIIHDREAHDDCYEILKKFNLKEVIFHCFSGNKDFAKKCLDEYYIAIGGIVTFKNATDTKESAKYIPLDRLLLETDAPYLAPVPYRGKLNTPAYLKYTAQEIANLKNIDIEIIKEQTTQNAKKVFGI